MLGLTASRPLGSVDTMGFLQVHAYRCATGQAQTCAGVVLWDPSLGRASSGPCRAAFSPGRRAIHSAEVMVERQPGPET